ncbi:hypothetical protein [Endozoicomonas sp. YOMI1]|uniref:hypothetical protein n=1 Tax=Endozoicomonas sp. YOMI1 TaxID=2828739 RepID=UPI0021474E34|nr:hypothetical protein [Endozoicomonas sp. YOMI1]
MKLDAQRVVASAQIKPDYANAQPEELIDRYVMQLPETTARNQLEGIAIRRNRYCTKT